MASGILIGLAGLVVAGGVTAGVMAGVRYTTDRPTEEAPQQVAQPAPTLPPNIDPSQIDGDLAPQVKLQAAALALAHPQIAAAYAGQNPIILSAKSKSPPDEKEAAIIPACIQGQCRSYCYRG